MKPAINLYLVTSTACNVLCKSCPAGRREAEPGGVMSMNMLRRILDKCVAESRVLGVQLYHYNEPSLVPHMPEMIRECHNRGLPVFFSSNLVVWKPLPAILAESPDMFLISVSGFTQAVYERSHARGIVEEVKLNMQRMRPLVRSGTTVQVSWHDYKYNRHELPLMREYSKALDYQFVPYATSLIPHDRAMREWETGIPDPAGEDLLISVKDAKELCWRRRHWDCILQQQVVAVNGVGDFLLCSNFGEAKYYRGSFFAKPMHEHLAARYRDPVCIACKSVGGHVYAAQAYTRSEWSPLRLVESVYRRLHLQGISPRLSAWATRSLYFIMRPQPKG